MIIFLLILVIRIIVISNGLRIGGDSEIVLTFKSSFLNYFWGDNGLGSFSGSGLRLFSSVLDFLFSFVDDYRLRTILVLFLSLIVGGLGIYYFSFRLIKKKMISLVLSIFVLTSFIFRGSIVRQTYFIVLVFVLTPRILYIIDNFLENDKIDKTNILLLIFFGFFEGVIANNPGFLAPQLLIIILFVIFKFFIQGKGNIKRIILVFLTLGWSFVGVLISMVVFMKFNFAITEDERNNKILLDFPLARQSKEMNLSKAIRGYNLDIFDSYGRMNDQIYYPYKNVNILSSNWGLILTLLPIFFIVLGLLFIKPKKDYLFWLIIFLFSIWVYKGAGYPGGGRFVFLLEKYQFLGIFRNPHQKFAIVYLISLVILLGKTILELGRLNKKIGFLFALSLCLSSIYLFGPLISLGYIPQAMNPLEIPKEYEQIANILNQDIKTYRILNLPFTESTMINTDWGYEGYNLFGFLLKKKSIWNRNDIAFSTYNNKYIDLFGKSIINQNGEIIIGSGFMDDLYALRIDTIILDKNIDNFNRFHDKTDIIGYDNYLKSLTGLTYYTGLGRIDVYKVASTLNIPIVDGNNLNIVTKINPTKYELELTLPAGSTGQELSFLQSYHPEWKLYPGKPIDMTSCKDSIIYTGSDTTPLVTESVVRGDTLYRVQRGDTLTTIAAQYDIPRSQLISDNKLVGPKWISIGQVLQIKNGKRIVMSVTTGSVATGGQTTECIRDTYTFFEGEELSYLWKKPVFDTTHKVVNDYANGWTIDLNSPVIASQAKQSIDTGGDSSTTLGMTQDGEIYLQKGLREGWIIKNEDDTYTVYLTLYFRPQSRFYLGLGVSGLTLMGLLSWLLRDWKRKRNISSRVITKASQRSLKQRVTTFIDDITE
ncbi:membrane-bound lytic murein transglycosylase D [candidate division SR1 bacterium Aalborg_AAW-1]|nr:membrane-bound lytic murein transglycosylase D [candidate division SR1 bacterium Aalborg_AAW-1]